MDHTDHFDFWQKNMLISKTIDNHFFEKKTILHFIRNMHLFCGGNFLKMSLVRGPLEAYIFIFWKCWKQPILRTSHPGCHSIKPVNWTAILAVIQSNQ